MKRLAIPLMLLAAAGGTVALLRNGPARPSVPTHASVAAVDTSSRVLGVDAVMKDVDSHRGPVVVEGVVKSASPESTLVELIDCEEFRSCGTTTCARLILPVRWSGQAPANRSTVRATGQVQEEAGKLVFVASAIEATAKEAAR